MAEQSRSLISALKCTPEVESFITGKPQSIKKAPRKTETTSTKIANIEPTETSKQVIPPQRIRKMKKSIPPKQSVEPIFEARIAVTTRLRQPTAESLRRLSLERKIRGERPWSQQEIIELAVNNWLNLESKNETPI